MEAQFYMSWSNKINEPSFQIITKVNQQRYFTLSNGHSLNNPKWKADRILPKERNKKKCARKKFSCDIWKMFEKREIMIDILKCFLPSIYYVYDVIGDFNLIFFSLNFKVFLFLAHFPKIVMPWISVSKHFVRYLHMK